MLNVAYTGFRNVTLVVLVWPPNVAFINPLHCDALEMYVVALPLLSVVAYSCEMVPQLPTLVKLTVAPGNGYPKSFTFAVILYKLPSARKGPWEIIVTFNPVWLSIGTTCALKFP
jgi:hypothetical protein